MLLIPWQKQIFYYFNWDFWKCSGKLSCL